MQQRKGKRSKKEGHFCTDQVVIQNERRYTYKYMPLIFFTWWKEVLVSVRVVIVVASLLALPFGTQAALTCDVGGENEKPADLEARLAICQAEIKQQSTLVDIKKREATSLSRDISILKSKIDKAKAEIKARDLNIKKLDGGIQQKEKELTTLEQKIARMQASAAKLLRNTRELEGASLYQVLLSDQTLSSFFLDIDNFASIEGALKTLFGEIKIAKAETKEHKEELATKKTKEAQLKAVQLVEQKKTQVLQSEKDRVLRLTKGEEEKYKAVLAEKQKIAAEIRNRLIRLTGGGQLKFGDALQLARIPEAKTGTRAAFLLAILTQETGVNGVIGGNLGRCFYNTPRNTPSGTIMSASQTPAFLKIMAAIGKDPNTTPVSCPISKDGTYGGAMGPAQFMPTTWLGYMDRVTATLGSGAASPFDNLSAFTASALYLSDGLADCRGIYSTQYDQERCAAAKYYAGGNWRRHMNGYGKQVANRAAQFQKDIDILDAQ